jgi:hypothetical protein
MSNYSQTKQSFGGAEGGVKKRFELPGQAVVRRVGPKGHLAAAPTFDGAELRRPSICPDIRQNL